MSQLVLHCMLDIKVDWNPEPSVRRRTTFKYLEGVVDLDLSHHSSETTRCPCCSSPVTFTVYPGLPFGAALALAWKANAKSSFWFLVSGVVLSLVCLPVGVLLLFGAGWMLLFEDFNGLSSNRKLKIENSTGKMHQVFFRRRNVTAMTSHGLPKRLPFYGPAQGNAS